MDTDSDGSPDFAEFEMQADPNHPFFALADAFNADVDNNGVADGVQLDLDGDQTPDAVDIAAGDPIVTYVKEPEPRYAIFPITGVEPPVNETAPIQINDQGRVLYVNGTWSGAGWTPLAAEGANLQECEAFGMNDFGDIIGRGSYRLQEDPEYRTPMLVHWTSPAAQPAAVISGEHHATPTYDMSVRQMAPGPTISNDRKVIAQSFTVDHPPQGGVDPQPDPAHHIWTINGASSAKGEEVPGMVWISDALTYWGRNSSGNGKIKMPERVLDDISFVPRNVVEIGPDVVAAFSPEKTDIAFQGAWLGGGGAYANVLDISQEGVAISRSKEGVPPAVLLNGQWRQLSRTAAFDVPQEWRSAGVEFLDTSSFGWVLARKGGNPAPDHAAMLPVRLEARFTDRNGQTVTKAAGVDDVSTGADLMEDASKDRIWIMAPQGVAKTVVWTSPLAGANPLEISGAGLKFGGAASAELSGYQSVVNIQADPGPSGTEVLLDLKLAGTTASVSKPVGVKIMKQRTIKLAVYQVTKAATATEPAIPASLVPDAQEMEDYLNDIYRPQLNVNFDVKVEATPLVVDWDVGMVNKSLDGNGLTGVLSGEQSAIEAKKNELLAQQAQEPGHTPFDEHLTLYLVGCQKPISTDAYGIASRLTKTCWVIGNFVSKMGDDDILPYDPGIGNMHNIAHEIGHILVGPGHPDEKEGPGPAELVGTNRKERLMASGSASGSDSALMHGKVLVKGEWDAADEWMATGIDDPQQ